MEIGLRILALLIDMAFCLGTLPLVLTGGGWVVDKLGGLGIILIPFWFIFIILWPVLLLAVPMGIWGKTLGKFLCRLHVTDFHGNPPGIWRATGREILKFLAIGSGFGMLLTLCQILYQGGTWYDHLCGTQVSFSPYIRLTQTQKNWRKHMKDRS